MIKGQYYTFKTGSKTPLFQTGTGKYLGEIIRKDIRDYLVFETDTRGITYTSAMISRDESNIMLYKFLNKHYGKNQVPSNKRFYIRYRSEVLTKLDLKEKYKLTLSHLYD